MKKTAVIKYKVVTDKANRKIVVISDFHDYPGGRKTDLAQRVKDLKPDLILLAGDLIQGTKYRNPATLKQIRDFLAELSEDCPVVICRGNHDLIKYDEAADIAYRSLEDARPGMVFPLENEKVSCDDIRVVEFTPGRKSFAPSGQDSGFALRDFVESWEKSGIKFEEDDKFSILLTHNPKIVAQALSTYEQKKLGFTGEMLARLKELSNTFNQFDMFACGHLHSGYRKADTISANPDKYIDRGYWEMPLEVDINGKTTFFRPWVYKETDFCRGNIYVGKGGERVIQLENGHYYYFASKEAEPVLIDEDIALNVVETRHLKPIIISGGVNKFFGLPIDKSEITEVSVLKKVR